jgi:hypothetical protein
VNRESSAARLLGSRERYFACFAGSSLQRTRSFSVSTAPPPAHTRRDRRDTPPNRRHAARYDP